MVEHLFAIAFACFISPFECALFSCIWHIVSPPTNEKYKSQSVSNLKTVFIHLLVRLNIFIGVHIHRLLCLLHLISPLPSPLSDCKRIQNKIWTIFHAIHCINNNILIKGFAHCRSIGLCWCFALHCTQNARTYETTNKCNNTAAHAHTRTPLSN